MGYDRVHLSAHNGYIEVPNYTHYAMNDWGGAYTNENSILTIGDDGRVQVFAYPEDECPFDHLEIDGQIVADNHIHYEEHGCVSFYLRSAESTPNNDYIGNMVVAVFRNDDYESPQSTVFGAPIRKITASGYYGDEEEQNTVKIVGLVTNKVETIQAWSSDQQEYIETDAYVVNVIQHDGCNLKSDVAYVTDAETIDTHDMYAYYYAGAGKDNPNRVYDILGGGVVEAVLGDSEQGIEPTIEITNSEFISWAYTTNENGIADDGNGGNDNPSDPPAPDEPTPTPPDDGGEKQCTEAVRDYIVKRTGVEDFNIYYGEALNEYAGYEASFSQDFAEWFVDTYAKRESEYVTYISGLLAEGFTHLDVLTVLECAKKISRLKYTFNCIRNGGKTYGRYVEINGTAGNRGGNKQNFYEFHLKGGFSGEKAVINGVNYYVVNVIENNGWHTRDDGEGGTVREYCEPVCTIDDGKCYFKSRTTTNPNDMFLYIQGMWVSVGYVASAFGVTSDNYTIEYSGNDITQPNWSPRRLTSIRSGCRL